MNNQSNNSNFETGLDPQLQREKVKDKIKGGEVTGSAIAKTRQEAEDFARAAIDKIAPGEEKKNDPKIKPYLDNIGRAKEKAIQAINANEADFNDFAEKNFGAIELLARAAAAIPQLEGKLAAKEDLTVDDYKSLLSISNEMKMADAGLIKHPKLADLRGKLTEGNARATKIIKEFESNLIAADRRYKALLEQFHANVNLFQAAKHALDLVNSNPKSTQQEKASAQGRLDMNLANVEKSWSAVDKLFAEWDTVETRRNLDFAGLTNVYGGVLPDDRLAGIREGKTVVHSGDVPQNFPLMQAKAKRVKPDDEKSTDTTTPAAPAAAPAKKPLTVANAEAAALEKGKPRPVKKS